MRIERNGPSILITPRFEHFVQESLGGISLDDGSQEESKRPDWYCAEDKIAIEVKTLADAGEQRLSNLQEILERRDDWPLFFGKVSSEQAFKHTSDPEGLKHLAVDRIGRPIRTHIRKANAQLGEFSRRQKDPALLRLLVLINEDHEIYNPSLVEFVVASELRRRRNKTLTRPNIDGAIYLSERHATMVDDQLQFAILVIDGFGCGRNPEKQMKAKNVAKRWVHWLNFEDVSREASSTEFEPIEIVPDQMSLNDFWRLEYRRSPYLKSLSDERLRDRFEEVMVQELLCSNPRSPLPKSERDTKHWLKLLTHIWEECSQRGLPATALQAEKQRFINAARRAGLPPSAEEWVAGLFH